MDEESILKSLTVNGDGILQSLDGLSKCGKIFFYSCVHLLEKPLGLDPNKHINTLNTFKFLSENNNISVSKNDAGCISFYNPFTFNKNSDFSKIKGK